MVEVNFQKPDIFVISSSYIFIYHGLPVGTYEHLPNHLKNPGVGGISRFSSSHNLYNR